MVSDKEICVKLVCMISALTTNGESGSTRAFVNLRLRSENENGGFCGLFMICVASGLFGNNYRCVSMLTDCNVLRLLFVA